MGAFIIIGGQWGDEGKGLISAYIARRERATHVCRGGTGPNAEHGIFLEDEKTYLRCNQLPLGWIFSPDTKILIGSGVAVNPDLLLEEIRKYNLYDRVFVDYRAPIITKKNISDEVASKGMQAIGSTMSGTGECKKDFVARKALQARNIDVLAPMLCDIGDEINKASELGTVMVEGSQGTFLSLAYSPDYPNVTSDNVTTMAVADDVLLSWKNINNVVLVVKTMPTREGNQYSKNDMGSGKELSEEEMSSRNIIENSSIPGKIRRKSEFDFDMLKKAVVVNGATQIAITFMEHMFPEVKNVKTWGEISQDARDFIEKVEKESGIPVTILNTGKPYNNIIDISFRPKLVNWDDVKKDLPKYENN